ncbi:hypothetical protein AAG570_004386 [Ranatra chinensis]|uniref:Uncharacterized protein n=1 Tax=Ranatra chinensis TaxID=642074 RepID=A0ABD0YFF5_9HEMI
MDFAMMNLKDAVTKAEVQIDRFSRQLMEVEELVLSNINQGGSGKGNRSPVMKVAGDGNVDAEAGSFRVQGMLQLLNDLKASSSVIDEELQELEFVRMDTSRSVEKEMASLEKRFSTFKKKYGPF